MSLPIPLEVSFCVSFSILLLVLSAGSDCLDDHGLSYRVMFLLDFEVLISFKSAFLSLFLFFFNTSNALGMIPSMKLYIEKFS